MLARGLYLIRGQTSAIWVEFPKKSGYNAPVRFRKGAKNNGKNGGLMVINP